MTTNNSPTNPTGCSFLSYRRSRLHEAKLLIQAQHELGIPTWQDVKDLDEGPTESNIRAVLDDPDTANAILWLTPEVEQSDFIQKIEAPLILERQRKNDGFFVIPVAAGGLDYESAATLGSKSLGNLSIAAFKSWNLREVKQDPVEFEEAAEIAGRVLERRIKTIQKTLPTDEPLKISFYTRKSAPIGENLPLSIDWSHQFTDREALPLAWNNHLLPALKTIVNMLDRYAPGRRIEAQGFCTIPAGVALGATFLAPRGIKIGWMQKTPGADDQLWSLGVPPVPSGFQSQIDYADSSAQNLAVLVSVADDVSRAFEASRPDLLSFRAVLSISKPGGLQHHLTEPGQATELAYKVIEAIRNFRKSCFLEGRIHLFMAVPVGLAMLIGQLLNTLGLVQTYEHIAGDGPGVYRPAALLRPSF